MQDELHTLLGDPIAIQISLKDQLKKLIYKSVPGENPAVLVKILREGLTSLASDAESIETGVFVKDMILLGLKMVNNEEIHEARAEGLAMRYKALRRAGLPEEFARQIMVAEASRAINLSSPVQKK